MLWKPIGGTIHSVLIRRLLVLKGHSTRFRYLRIRGASAIDRRSKELLLAHKSFVIERQGLLSLRSDITCCGIIFEGRYLCITAYLQSLFLIFYAAIRAHISASNIISTVYNVEVCRTSDWLCRRALVCISRRHDGL